MLAAVTPPKQAFTPKRKRRVTWERTDRVKAARRLKYGRRETFTVKTGLRSTCHKNGFIDAVNASLQFTSQCFHEASLLLHLFILDRCSRNLPIEKYNLTFFFDCFVAITRLGNKPDKNLHEDLWAVRDELYNPVRSVALPLQDRTGRNVLLHHLAKELETSFKNNISLNFIGRLEKWCNCVVFLTFPGASSERRRTLVKFLLNGISWNQTEIQLPGASEEEEVYLNLFLDHARQGHSNLLPLSEKHIQANYQEYIKWSWSILQDLQQFHYEIFLVQEYIRHEGEVVQGPRLRNLLFSLAPKASLKAHHLSLDTLGFEEIIRWSVTNGFQNAMDAIPSVKQAAKETDEVKRARWFEYFDLDQFITHEGSDMGHKFGRYVSTDGCSLSLKMTRLKEDNTTDRDPYHFPESWMENEDSLRLIGIDPGSRDMITGAVQGDCRAEPQTVSFSGERFYHESFMIKARSWRERQLAAAPNNLRAVISDLPSSRVARVEDLMNYIHSWTPHLVQALGHFGALQHRNMTKKVYSRRQATLVKVCKLITGGQPKEQVVVGFGDASVGHGSCIPRRNQGPVKALIRVLHRFARVVMVDEFRTSRVCSTALLSGDRCESRLRPFRFAGVDGPRQPYPLQICPDCAMIWNRDINASRNILYCLQRLAARLERPSSMRRQAALDIQGILAEEAVLALEDEHIALAHAH